MTTFSVEFKEAEKQQIEKWVDYLKSLDFIQAIKPKGDDVPYLSMEDIKKQYPNQWVLLSDTKVKGIQILGGRVILSHSDKREFAIQGRDLVKTHNNVRHYYTGERLHQKHIGLIVKRNNEQKL
jgi:hypothetical protein